MTLTCIGVHIQWSGYVHDVMTCIFLSETLQAIMALYEYPTNKATRPSHIVGSMVKTPLTGVDASASWTLSFSPSKETQSTLSAQAILSTNIHVEQHSPAVVIRYQHGVIEVPAPPFAPKGFTVTYFNPNKDSETKKIAVDWQGGGWHFQADEVARCVRDGKLKSDLWGWDKSLLEMDVFDEVSFKFCLPSHILTDFPAGAQAGWLRLP